MVKLVSDVPAEIANFGGSVGHEFVDVALTATPALPHTLRADQISLGVLRRFMRSSQTLRRETAPTPTFTEPQTSPNRDRVTFTVCLSGSGLKAGAYGGNVYIDGPPGLSPASVSITENVKDRSLAIGGTIVALAAAFMITINVMRPASIPRRQFIPSLRGRTSERARTHNWSRGYSRRGWAAKERHPLPRWTGQTLEGVLRK